MHGLAAATAPFREAGRPAPVRRRASAIRRSAALLLASGLAAGCAGPAASPSPVAQVQRQADGLAGILGGLASALGGPTDRARPVPGQQYP